MEFIFRYDPRKEEVFMTAATREMIKGMDRTIAQDCLKDIAYEARSTSFNLSLDEWLS